MRRFLTTRESRGDALALTHQHVQQIPVESTLHHVDTPPTATGCSPT
jgi:hypothetical protein